MRLRRQDSEKWMSHRSLPEELKKRIRKYEEYKWQETRGFDEETVISNLPADLRTDIKRHLWNLCFDHIMRVPWFRGLSEDILDAMCDWLKPVVYMKNSLVLREGHPVKEVLFIMRGTLTSVPVDDNGTTSDFNTVKLRAGDYCGYELLVWATDPKSSCSSDLPTSAATLKTLTEVEGFTLKPDHLTYVMQHMRRLHGARVKHVFRYYSQQWRMWAACFIQAAWRRHKRRKLAKHLEKARDDALATVRRSSPPPPKLGPILYASRFAARALRNLRRDKPQYGGISQAAIPSDSGEP